MNENKIETMSETTVATENETTKKSKWKASFSSLNFRGGMYAVTISAIAIILVIAINLIAGKLDIRTDLTATGLYTLSEETEEFLDEIQDEIVLYYFVQSGSQLPEIDEVIKKYDDYSSKLRLVTVDPVLHPNYAEGLIGTEAAESLEYNSVIVVNETRNRSRMVLKSEMIVSTTDYTTYETTYYSDVEGQIDSALLYVTNEDLPVMYVVTGHNEMVLTEAQQSLITKNNVEMIDLETLTTNQIPEDCDILFMNYPYYDITEAEADLIIAYLDAGGKAILNVDYTATSFPNLNRLLNNYGVELVEGIVYETDSRYYAAGYPYFLLPAITEHDITDGVKGKKKLFMPQASGLRIMENKRSTITATELFTTTEGAYSKVDLYSMGENKEEGDIDGPFALGVYVTETFHGVTSQLIVYSSYLFDETLLTQNSYGNKELLLNTLNFLAEMRSTIYIPTRNLNQQVPSWNLTGAQFLFHTAIKLILLPLGCLIAGGVILFLRRRAR